MRYINNTYYIDKVSAEKISKKFNTPSYVYSYNKILESIRNFKSNFKKIDPFICFSVKSNSNLSILKIMKKNGLGADVVSMGELMICLKAGFNPKKIVFSGVGKTFEELKYAIEKNILLINAESEGEIVNIEKIAKIKNKKIKIGLRLNPDTDAKTLQKISTGKKDDKFGIDSKNLVRIIKKYRNSKFLNFVCLSTHIGSQISNYKPYIKMLRSLQICINECGHKFDYIDLGGGMSIKYKYSDKELNYKKYSKYIERFKKKNNCKIIFEPGRSLIAKAGVIISKIIYIKDTDKKKFVVIDAAMNNLIRPALYEANHSIIPSKKTRKKIKKKHEFVGPICETSDKFLELPNYQKINQNDNLVICDAGAYGVVLSSNYNLRPSAPELLVNGKEITVIKKRQKLSDLIS